MEYTLWEKLLPFINGAGVTLLIFGITLIGSLPLGWLLSLLRVAKNKIVSKIVELYCWIFRGTPLMLQLTFVYYGLPLINKNWRIDAFVAVIVVYILNYAAYFAEIFRGGIESIDRGQYEAADSLGLRRNQVMTRIVLPQALRRVLPSIGNEVITLVKDTSLAYTITVGEILRVAQKIAIRDFNMTPFIGVAVFYLAFSYIASKVMARIESRFEYYD